MQARLQRFKLHNSSSSSSSSQLQHNHHQYYHNHLQRFRLLLRARLPCSVSERWGLRRAWQVLLCLWLPGACIITINILTPINLGEWLLRRGGLKLSFNATKCPPPQGEHCQDDIDECLLGPAVHQCGRDSRCVNRFEAILIKTVLSICLDGNRF